ncbi:MAG TPA: sigma-70 family RNA polymerase sigma factor, partial [Planctomycetaceae bacterium]|nr:sigma-70 family RNA polymerase sigma factor [Planctomycetaceae bacterium]
RRDGRLRPNNVKENGTDQNPVLRDPDVRLMLRAKEGDQTAFTQLVSTYQDRLVGVLTHLLQNQDAAEDLAQEVFFRIYRARHGYVPTAKFSTWLFRIANNLASNLRRDTGRRRETLLNVNDSGPLGPRPGERLLADKSGMMPTRQADKTEMCAVVQSALATLSDEQRLAVLLHKFEEMSYADIAVTLDKTPAAVKSLLSRARDNLREKLEPYVKQGVLG